MVSERMTEKASVSEFREACSRNLRRLSVLALISVGVLAICFAIVILNRDSMLAFWATRLGNSNAELAIGFTPMPALVVFLVGVVWHERLARRDRRLLCPSCNRFLAGDRSIVIATKTCPYCGRRPLPLGPDEEGDSQN